MLLDSDRTIDYCGCDPCPYEDCHLGYCKVCHHHHIEPEHQILIFPTKLHFRDPSELEYIEAGMQKFVQTYAAKGIKSVAFPRLGCGLGGLDWDTQVNPLMKEYLSSLPIKVLIYQSILSPTKPGSPARGPGKSK